MAVTRLPRGPWSSVRAMASLETPSNQRHSNAAWLEMQRAEKVPEIVARRILQDILRRNLRSGDKLPAEAEMLASLGIGRASLREALRILETHGLVRIKPGPQGGPIVTEPSPSDYGQTTTLFLHRMRATFAELLEARLILEPMMTRLAAERMTPELAQRLNDATAAGWAAIDADAETWSEAAEEFHTVICAASDNRVLDLYSAALVAIERNRMAPLFSEPTDRRSVLRVHDRIAAAILEKNAPLAEELARKHMRGLSRVWSEQFANQMSQIVEWR